MVKIHLHQGGCVDFEKELIDRTCRCGCGEEWRCHPKSKRWFSSLFCEHKTVVDAEYIKKRPGVSTRVLNEYREKWKLKLRMAERIAKLGRE